MWMVHWATEVDFDCMRDDLTIENVADLATATGVVLTDIAKLPDVLAFAQQDIVASMADVLDEFEPADAAQFAWRASSVTDTYQQWELRAPSGPRSRSAEAVLVVRRAQVF